jgi:two-component system, LytTR family, sensor histidine kinase AlgZ
MKTRIAYWTCQAAGWGFYTVMGISMAAQQVGWRFSMIAGYILFCLYSIALTDLLRREIRRRRWLNTLTFFTFARLFGAALVLAAIQTFLVFTIDLAFNQRSSMVFSQPSYILSTWISVSGADSIWLLFYVALTAGRRYREKEVRLQLALREAELRALEAQINPHFLFNCLNSIRALVVENPPLAQDMLTRFATILRYNLHRNLNHTVPLEAEVEIVSDYLALESIRLEDRLRVHLAIDSEAGKVAIPPMLLQTLVENAVKHGIAPLPNGGDLVIRAAINGDSLRLDVENTGSISGPTIGSTRVGLGNTRERLRILYGDRAQLDLRNGDGHVMATVIIPRAL